MSVTTDVARAKKLVMKTVLLDVLRHYPGLIEQELQSVLESWMAPVTKEDYIKRYGEPLPWDTAEPHELTPEEQLRPPMTPQEVLQRPRLHGPEKPVLSESRALRIIEDLAHDIPAEELYEKLYLQISINRRTSAEMSYLFRHRYFPEQEPDKSRADIEYFQQHGSWPQSDGGVRALSK